MAQNIKCPHCGSFNTKKTLKGNIERGAATVVSYGVGNVANSLISSISPIDTHCSGAIAKTIKSWVPIEHECKDCDCSFEVSFDTENAVVDTKIKKAPVPDNIIKDVKTQYEKDLKARISYFGVIFNSIITVGLFVYLWISDFTYQVWHEETWFRSAGYHTEYHYGWLFWAFLFIVFLIITISSFGSLEKKKSDLELSKRISLREFKHNHRELFENYPQYR